MQKVNKIYLELTNSTKGIPENIIPLINLPRALGKTKSSNRMKKFQCIIDEIFMERYKERYANYAMPKEKKMKMCELRIKNKIMRELLGMRELYNNDDFIFHIFNEILEKYHLERKGANTYIKYGEQRIKRDFENFADAEVIVGNLLGYCTICKMDDRKFEAKLKINNRVTMKCQSCNVKQSYHIVIE